MEEKKVSIPSVPICHSERLALSCCAYNYVMSSVQLCHVARTIMSCRAKSRHLLFLENSGVEKSIACRPLDCARGDKNAYSNCVRGDKNGFSDCALADIVVSFRFF